MSWFALLQEYLLLVTLAADPVVPALDSGYGLVLVLPVGASATVTTTMIAMLAVIITMMAMMATMKKRMDQQKMIVAASFDIVDS